MKRLGILLSSIVVLLALGCASIMHGGREEVALSSQPTDAEVVVVDDRGTEVFRGRTPATTLLKPGRAYFKKRIYTVTFTKPGFAPVSVKTDSKIVGWYWANFALGGLIGFFAVDPVTGDMYTIKRKQVDVNLRQQSSWLDNGNLELRILDLSELSPSVRERLVKVE